MLLRSWRAVHLQCGTASGAVCRDQASVLYHAGFSPHQLLRLCASAGCADLVLQALVVVLAVVAVAAVLKNMYALPKMPVYLVDFSVHKGLDEWRFSKDMFVPLSRETGVSDDAPSMA